MFRQYGYRSRIHRLWPLLALRSCVDLDTQSNMRLANVFLGLIHTSGKGAIFSGTYTTVRWLGPVAWGR